MTDSFTRILSGAKSALAYMEGNSPEGTIVHVPEDLDVAEIRNKTGLAQPAFAATIGVLLHTSRIGSRSGAGRRGPPGCFSRWSGNGPRWCRRSLGRWPDRAGAVDHRMAPPERDHPRNETAFLATPVVVVLLGYVAVRLQERKTARVRRLIAAQDRRPAE